MRILKQLSIYTFAGFFGAGINFFIMPVLSHYLAPFDYGIISIFNTYVTILIPLIGLLASSFLTVEYYKSKDKIEFASKFISVQIVPIFPFLIFSLLVYFSYDRLAITLELANTNKVWGLGIVFLAIATIYVETFFNFLVIQKKTTTYALFNVLKVLVEVGITLWLVIGRGWGWQGRLYAWLVTSIIFLVVSFFYFKREGFLEGKVKWHFMKEGILFGLPLILHTIGKFVINQSDRLFIAKMISLNEAGIYNLGYTVGTLIMILINAFFNFYSPFLMERLSAIDEEKKFQIVKMSYLFMIGAFASLVLISVLAPFFFSWFVDSRYNTATQYVFWVGLGYVFWGGYMLFATYIFYYKQNRILGWLAMLNVIVNIGLNYFFIKLFGAIGAAYATALSFFIVFIIVALFSDKLIKLPWLQFRKAMLVRLA
jgi:O-antigen/teichoic acid export membrane protein